MAKIPYAEVKYMVYIQDFDEDLAKLDGLQFFSRPKLSGLWVRMKFRDGALLDGVLPNSLLQMESAGFTVTPPEQTTNPPRVFVPKAALSEFAVVAVIGSPVKMARRKKTAQELLDERQIGLFDDLEDE